MDHLDIRPDYLSLKEEILARRKTSKPWANTDKEDFPTLPVDSYTYLGLIFDRSTDRVFLRPKPLFLKYKLKGPADVSLRNLAEFNSYLDLG